MKFFTKCEICHENKFYIKKRTFKPNRFLPSITSNNMMCNTCWKLCKKLNNSDGQK